MVASDIVGHRQVGRGRWMRVAGMTGPREQWHWFRPLLVHAGPDIIQKRRLWAVSRHGYPNEPSGHSLLRRALARSSAGTDVLVLLA